VTTTDELTIEQAITIALDDLRDARVAAAHSPNADSIAYVALCQSVLDEYLDAWPDYQH